MESASDKTPPATGTVEPIINFAVRRDKLSAEELTAVCMLKMPMNRVDIKPITQRDSFLTELAKFVLCIRGDTDAATLKEYWKINHMTAHQGKTSLRGMAVGVANKLLSQRAKDKIRNVLNALRS